MRTIAAFCLILVTGFCALASPASEIVKFPSGSRELHGVLFKPDGAGPFPTVLYNHGSAAGMLSQQAFDTLGPIFLRHGWVFFGPYRRGQGLSAQAGPFIGDQIEVAKKQGGISAGAATMVRLLETDHLDDQLAALAWLRKPERERYCAAVDSAGGAESWDLAPVLQERMKQAVQHAQAPIFLFQAQNDWNLSPSKVLSAAMKASGKPRFTHRLAARRQEAIHSVTSDRQCGRPTCSSSSCDPAGTESGVSPADGNVTSLTRSRTGQIACSTNF